MSMTQEQINVGLFDEVKKLQADHDKWQGIAERLANEMTRLRDCDWVITLPDRMDAVRDVARKALADFEEAKK